MDIIIITTTTTTTTTTTLRQVESLSQSKFTRECDIMIPLSIFSIIAFP
jgi:hypothetical protein